MKQMWFEDSLYPIKRESSGVVIEDRTKVRVMSGMIAKCYEDGAVSFLNGASYMVQNLCQIKDNTLVYLDVVPDNVHTIQNFERAMKYSLASGNTCIKVVPIPCIEYYLIKCFGRDCTTKDIIVNRRLYQEDIVARNNMSTKRQSFEKFCKAAVSTLVNNTYIGTVKADCFDVSFEDCSRFVLSLPVVYKSPKIIGETYKVVLKDVIFQMYDRFIQQYKLYEGTLNLRYDIMRLDDVFNRYLVTL